MYCIWIFSDKFDLKPETSSYYINDTLKNIDLAYSGLISVVISVGTKQLSLMFVGKARGLPKWSTFQ